MPHATTMCRKHSAAFLSSLLLVGTFTGQVAANGEHGVTFLFPVGGKDVYNKGDTVKVTYTTPFSEPRLYTWCMPDLGNPIQKQLASPLNSSELILLDFSSDDCWFNLRPGDVAGFGANSDHFKVMPDERPQKTTWGLEVQLPTATASTSTSSSSTSRVTSAGTSSSSSTAKGTATSEPEAGRSKDGLSPGEIAGICIGTVTLAVLLASVGVACYTRRRKQRTPRGGVVNYSQAPGSDQYSRGEKFSVTPYSSLHSGSSYRPLSGTDSQTAVSGHGSPSQGSAKTYAKTSNINMTSLSEGYFRHDTGAAELRSGGFGLDGSVVNDNPNFEQSHQTQQGQTSYELYQTLPPNQGPHEIHGAIHEQRAPPYQQAQNLGLPDMRSPGSVQATPIGYVGGFKSKEEEAGFGLRDQAAKAHVGITRPPEPAELPSKDSYRGYGEEYEMPVIQGPSRFKQPLRMDDMVEQKVWFPPADLPQTKNANASSHHRPGG